LSQRPVQNDSDLPVRTTTLNERNVLNIGLQKYRPGQSEPILIGGDNMLKPALRLMSDYRLRIDEIKGDAVLTSYTRWLEAVIVKGTVNQEIYVSFSPQFERICLESKNHLPEYVAEKPAILVYEVNIR
jgi:hypothetical protein